LKQSSKHEKNMFDYSIQELLNTLKK
jgi:hypothetical protein